MRLSGKEYALRFSVDVFFKLEEKYGTANAIEILTKPGAEGFNALCWLVAEMSKAAELYKRYMGESPNEYLKEEFVRAVILPWEMPKIRDEAIEAVMKGIQRQEESEEEIDIGLQELQKKTESE
ncbi:hypothetical protein AALG83_02245 [Christensenellaceae bacterium 44-20]